MSRSLAVIVVFAALVLDAATAFPQPPREASRESYETPPGSAPRCNGGGGQSRAHREGPFCVTDDQGRYQIVDLRPARTRVTFTWLASRRAAGGHRAHIGIRRNRQWRAQAGGLEETIVVSGSSPVVDVQNVLQQNLLPRGTGRDSGHEDHTGLRVVDPRRLIAADAAGCRRQPRRVRGPDRHPWRQCE